MCICGSDCLETLEQTITHCEQCRIHTCGNQTTAFDILGIFVSEEYNTPIHIGHSTLKERNENVIPIRSVGKVMYVSTPIKTILGESIFQLGIAHLQRDLPRTEFPCLFNAVYIDIVVAWIATRLVLTNIAHIVNVPKFLTIEDASLLGHHEFDVRVIENGEEKEFAQVP